MTADVIEDVLRLVRSGLHPERAAIALGIPPSTMRSHRARYPSFATQIDRAEAVSEGSALVVVQKAANGGDWKPAAWLLERRFPERWARPEVRAEITNVNLNAGDVAAAIHAGLAMLAARHAPPGAPDVEDDDEFMRGAGAPAHATNEPARAPSTVTRS